MRLTTRLLAEFLGTAFLLAAVVGSGIMGDRLSGGNAAIALLANSLATGLALSVLILAFGPLSGAHFNPVVTLSSAALGSTRWSDVPFYLMAQIFGAVLGVFAAHGMFGEPILALSHHARGGAGQLLGEFIATFGLVLFIQITSKHCHIYLPKSHGGNRSRSNEQNVAPHLTHIQSLQMSSVNRVHDPLIDSSNINEQKYQLGNKTKCINDHECVEIDPFEIINTYGNDIC